MWFLRRHRSKSNEEATEALADAQENLSRIEERGEEVTSISNSLRRIREKNHLVATMEELIARKKGWPVNGA